MQRTQRGSILITLIAGLLALSLLGTGIVTMMTSSTMTLVSDRASSQAYYLAETGVSILRSTFTPLEGAAMLTLADKLEGQPITIPANTSDDTLLGTVTLRFKPSWFHSESAWTRLPASAADLPEQNKSLLLTAVRSSGSGPLISLATPTASGTFPEYADLYLVGRVKAATVSGPTDGPWKLVVAPADGTVDFARFPDMYGLLGLVDASGVVSASKRFLYTKMTRTPSSVTFEGLRSNLASPSSSNKLTQEDLLNKNLVLGQYFQITSAGETANGARAALIYHTNGKNSFRYPGGSEGELTVTDTVGGTTSMEGGTGNGFADDLFKADKKDNLIAGDVQFRGDGANDGFSITMQVNKKNTYIKAIPNHFLIPEPNGKEKSPDSWFALLATRPLADTAANLDSVIQVSLRDGNTGSQGEANVFAGILCRLGIIGGGNNLAGNPGVRGLALGALVGSFTLASSSSYGYVVTESTLNPGLLPGFQYEPTPGDKQSPGFFYIKREQFEAYYRAPDMGKLVGNTYTLNPMLILWAYDDKPATLYDQNGYLNTLQWLAVAPLGEDDLYTGRVSSAPWNTTFYSKLAVHVQEKDGKNAIRAWIASQYPPKSCTEAERNDSAKISMTSPCRNGFIPGSSMDWPLPGALTQPANQKYFTLVSWKYINSYVSGTFGEDKGPNGQELTVTTTKATGNGYLRTGVFSGVYGDANITSETALFMRDFAFGKVTSEGGESDQSGLTPGIIQ